jgi:drug/metabolite transporter (DMT)-like permease
MNLTKEKQGELFIFSEAILWSLFPVVTSLTIKSLDTLIALGFTTFFSAVFFALLLTFRKKWGDLKNTKALQYILLATLFIGVIYYLLSFLSLQFTSPGNVGVIASAEVFFTYLFFNVWRKDALPGVHLIGAFFIVLGVIIIFAPSIHGFQIGDLMILSATAVAPFGNFFQQKARHAVSSECIMFVRSLVGMMVVFTLAFFVHASFSLQNLQANIGLLLFNGFLLFGLTKFLWVEGIHRISVTKAIALNGISPLLTLLFAWLIIHKAPTVYQLLAVIPMFFGVYLLSKTNRN